MGRGVFNGVTGIVTQPIRGAQRHGVEGFFQGAFRGVVGVVAQPLAGAFDLASEATAAVRHSAGPSRQDVARMRLPRAIGPEFTLRPYNLNDSRGQNLLFRLNGRNTAEKYAAKTTRCIIEFWHTRCCVYRSGFHISRFPSSF